MSSQSSVYSEKKIAAYESLFRESNFAKPQEVYLTLTVAHVFGQAYIVEQEGTKESDAVYSRFVCPLEEITKVYVNDKIKKPWPLFIQCDTNVKGVIHRKRIVIPCLENPTAIAEQINQVKAIHMEKYEAAVERENQKKRAELENDRMKEQIKNETKKVLPPLPTVEKLPDPIPEPAVPVAEAVTKAEPAPKAEAPAKTSPAKSFKSVKELASDLADSFKAFESMEASKPEIKPDIKPLPKKPVFDLDNLEEAFTAKPKFPEKPAAPAAEEPAPKAEAPQKPVLDLDSIPDAAEAKPAAEIPEPVAAAPKAEEKPAEPEILPAAEPEKPVETIPAPKPAPVPVRVNPNAKAAELNDFESAVIKLKERLDSGEISADEYAAEKKKLISTLY